MTKIYKFMLMVMMLCWGSVLPLQESSAQEDSTYTEFLTLGRGHITDLSINGDNQIIAVSSTSGIWLYDSNLADVSHLNAQKSSSVAWSHDGNRLAIGDYTGTVNIWDISFQNQRPKFDLALSFDGDGNAIKNLKWSFDDSYLATSDTDKILVLNVSEQTQIASYDNGTDFDWHPSENVIATSDVTGMLVQDLDSEETPSIYFGNEYGGDWIRWNNENQILYKNGRSLYSFSLTNNPKLLSSELPTSSKVVDLLDGQILWFGGENQVQIYNFETHEVATVSTVSAPIAFEVAIATSDPGQLIIVTPQQTLGILNIYDNKLVSSMNKHTNDGLDIAWNPTASLLGAAYINNVRIWDLDTSEVFLDLPEISSSISWSPTGEEFATVSNTVKIWNLDGDLIQELHIPEDQTTNTVSNPVEWGPDGNQIALKRTNTLIWDAETGELLTQLTCFEPYETTVRWSPDSQYLLGQTGVCDTTTDTKIYNFEPQQNIEWIENGDNLAFIRAFNTVEILNFSTENVAMTIEWPQGYLTGISWNSINNQLLAANTDKNVYIWDLSTGNQVNTIEGLIDTATDVVWRPSSTDFATISSTGIIQLWSLQE